jgi:transcriptional regulator with XRE-family HTH domain
MADVQGVTVDEHDRAIRAALRSARDAAQLTQQQVADRITSRLQLERPLTGAAVSEWERFGRHPPINVMRAWAAVLGRRILVQLDDSQGDRIAVLVHPEIADLARAIDLLSPEDREAIEATVSRFTRRRI